MNADAITRMLWRVTIAVLLATALLLARIVAAEESTPLAPASNASAVARAVQPPGAGGVDTDALDLARICYLESTFRRADCVAFFWVATKRAQRRGTHWADELKYYSVLYRVNTKRARETRALPWGDSPSHGPRFNRRWAELRALATELVAGQHADVCPGATHWGGTMDRPRGRMVPARCANRTANTFYRVSAK